VTAPTASHARVEARRGAASIEPAVSASALTVRRGAVEALHEVAFEIARGAVVGLFGPSGSGKSTLMRALAGVQAGVRGRLEVLGRPAGSAELRREVGYMTQAPAVYGDLTVAENLRYFAAVKGVRWHEELARVGLCEQAGQLVRQLSGGQLARVSLAAALLGRPALLLLDEPTVGLDPLLRRELWGLFGELAARGTTLLVSSHVLDEARHCQEVLLLRDGELLAHLRPEDLLARTGTRDMDEAFVRLIESGGGPR
jgi:ABC-2 type transport system ATP-binding protein